MSVQLASQDFTTPDKGGPTKMSAPSAMDTPAYVATTNSDMSNSYPVNSVTPTEASIAGKKTTPHQTFQHFPTAVGSATNTGSGKHVRFGAEGSADNKAGGDSSNIPTITEAAATTVASARGAVSRRGGRFVSPGRPMIAANAAATFRTPTATTSKTGSDTVPALSSAGSVGLVSMPSECEKDSKDSSPAHSDMKVKLEQFDGAKRDGEQGSEKRPTSISCGPSSLTATSPLAKASPQKLAPSFDDDSKTFVRSPVPSTCTESVSTVLAGSYSTLLACGDRLKCSPLPVVTFSLLRCSSKRLLQGHQANSIVFHLSMTPRLGHP